jgi:hypothetical protein
VPVGRSQPITLSVAKICVTVAPKYARAVIGSKVILYNDCATNNKMKFLNHQQAAKAELTSSATFSASGTVKMTRRYGLPLKFS